MCPGDVGHETNYDKTIAVEYCKDSGRVGSLRSFKNDFQNLVDFPSPKNGMVGCQNAHFDKQKHNGNKKPVFLPSQQQQQKDTALDSSEVTPNDETGSYTSESMYKDLDDGKYEKTIYVKTWTGRTITAVFSPEKVTKIVKGEIEAKTGIPTDHQLLVVRGKVLTDSASMKEHGISEGETIEMTAKLLGGMKHKSLSPKPMDTEREKKGKNQNRVSMGAGKKWMRETMKELRQRTDEVSMQRDMREVKDTLNKVTSSLVTITEGNETRDKKLDDLIASLSTGLADREKKTEERMDNMERSLGARMDERFSDFEKRISSIEKSTGGAGHTHPGSSRGGMGSHPNEPKSSDTRLQTGCKRTGSEKDCR